MHPTEVIRTKRDGGTLSRESLEDFILGHCRGDVSDPQMAAFQMAVLLRGMTFQETVDLTHVMTESGSVIVFGDIHAPVVDKHSTGGVGDKVSLILAPMVAACGAYVPMLSGRGLGHTGGTLDKLESIPGFRTGLSVEEFRAVTKEVGFAMASQSEELVPADSRMYALRDATATIESPPLIAGSILSKKLAEGIGALVLDVTVGDGAFMRTERGGGTGQPAGPGRGRTRASRQGIPHDDGSAPRARHRELARGTRSGGLPERRVDSGPHGGDADAGREPAAAFGPRSGPCGRTRPLPAGNHLWPRVRDVSPGREAAGRGDRAVSKPPSAMATRSSGKMCALPGEGG